jgi:hypothetical protein
MCRRRQGRFLSVNANTPFQNLLFDSLCRQGWVQR